MSFGHLAFSEFLAAVAARTPAPGGGAVASAAGALAGALSEMALRYSITKKTDENERKTLENAIAGLETARAALLALADADAAAYAELNRLQKLPEGDPGRSEIPAAALKAAAIPMETAEKCLDILQIAAGLTQKCNAWLISDLAIGVILAHAGLRAGIWNVVMNLGSLSPKDRSDMELRIAEVSTAGDRTALQAEGACRCRRPA